MATRWFEVPCVVLEPGRQERDAHPLRQPQGGRRRPHRQRRRRLRPLRRARASWSTWARPPPSRPSRRRASTSAGPSRPGVAISLDALFATRRRAAPGRAGRAPQRDRQVDRRVDPVGGALRLRRAGRRAVPALHGGARRVHGGGHRRPVRADHRAVLGGRSSTSSRGSPCTACASSTSATSPPPRGSGGADRRAVPAEAPPTGGRVIGVAETEGSRRRATVRPGPRGPAAGGGRVAGGPRGRPPGRCGSPARAGSSHRFTCCSGSSSRS